MPNWCEGSLKVRGTKENMTRFILEGLRPVGFLGEEKAKLQLDEYGDINSNETCWIENTRRGFVKGVEVYLSEYEDDETFVEVFDSKFAWGISADELLKTCEKYHVDMKIHGFEMGMEFNQDIEIVDGRILKYHIYSAGQVVDTSESYQTTFETDEEYQEFLNMTQSTSLYNTGVEVTTEDTIVTLSTCTSASDNHRFVVRGVKEEETKQ